MKSRKVDVALAAGLAIVTFLLYRKVTRLGWTYDDAYLLHIAIEHPARDHFFGRALWSTLAQPLFTPLLTATFDSELTLFGLNAAAFYRLQIVLLMALAVTVFLTARLWLPSGVAACASLLFIAGAPVCAIATQLMTVHYIESLIFMLAAVVAFVNAERRDSFALVVLSAVFYLAAMLAKEIAVPLIFLCMRRETRRVATLPHGIALLIYAFWRRADLGVWFGGYGWAIRPADVPSIVAAFPLAVFRQLTSPPTALGVALIAVLITGVVLWTRSPRRALLVLGLIVLSIAPVLPMARRFEARYTLALWLVCTLIAIAGFETLIDMRSRDVLIAIALLVVMVVNRQRWMKEFLLSQRMSDEARVFFDLGPGDALRKPAVPPAAMSELAWLKDVYVKRPSGALWFYDDLYLCTARDLPHRVFSYDAKTRTVIQEHDVAEVRTRFCATIRADAPLSATFERRDEALFWTLGPYQRGDYAIVFGDGISAFDIPRIDSFRVPRIKSLRLRVRYTAPERWVTYSPELALDFERGSTYAWRR